MRFWLDWLAQARLSELGVIIIIIIIIKVIKSFIDNKANYKILFTINFT